MVTKEKIQKDKKNTLEKIWEDITLPCLLESPSSWTATILNEKLWMRNAVFIGKFSTGFGPK